MCVAKKRHNGGAGADEENTAGGDDSTRRRSTRRAPLVELHPDVVVEAAAEVVLAMEEKEDKPHLGPNPTFHHQCNRKTASVSLMANRCSTSRAVRPGLRMVVFFNL
jgi:hypothetical protein